MSLLNIRCPECRAWLKAKTNFIAGEKVTCPKCETPFAVKVPDENDPLNATAGQSAKTQAEREFTVGSSGVSVLWLATFAVLVAGIVALGFVIAQKMPEKRDDANAADKANIKGEQPPPIDPKQPKDKLPKGKQPKDKQPKDKQPMDKLPMDKQPNAKLPLPGVGLGPFTGLFGGGNKPVPAAEREKLLQKYKTAIVGTWTADLGNGVTEELAYTADGTYTSKLTGAAPLMASGKYTVKELVGTKSLKIQLDSADGAPTVVVVFEDDELQHPTLQKGVTGSFRKK